MVIIRAYTDTDLQATADLWQRSWSAAFPHLTHPWPPARWSVELIRRIQEGEMTLIAEVDGAIAGFMVIDGATGYIDQLFTEPAAQGQGIGAALLTRAKALAPGRLTLHTLAENAAARGFYERHGFQQGTMGINRVNGRPNVEYVWDGGSSSGTAGPPTA